jgi:hypothetical protein
MLRFKEYLKEKVKVKWSKKTFDFVDNTTPYIPLSTKMFERLFGKQKINVFHMTDLEGVQELYDLQGKKKSISTFTEIESYDRLSYGVHRGGFLVELYGNLLFSEKFDVMSQPDEQGRRWLHPNLFLNANQIHDITNERDSIYADYMYPNAKPDKDGYTILNPEDKVELSKKDKSNIIKDYMDMIENYIMKNKKLKDELVSKLLKGHSEKLKILDEYNEYIVNNIKINNVYMFPNFKNFEYENEKLNVDQKIITVFKKITGKKDIETIDKNNYKNIIKNWTKSNVFKEYLKEKKIGGITRDKFSIINRILNNNPISLDKKLSEILETKKQDTYYHVTRFNSIPHVIKIEGSRKSISTMDTVPDMKHIQQGIDSQGGVLFELSGDPVISVDADIFSDIDEQGRRWTDSINLFSSKWKDTINLGRRFSMDMEKVKGNLVQDFKTVLGKYVDFKNKDLEMYSYTNYELAKLMRNINIENNYSSRISEMINVQSGSAGGDNYEKFKKDYNKLKGKYYKVWIDETRKWIEKNKDDIKEFFAHVSRANANMKWTKGIAPNETILQNIKIKKIEVYHINGEPVETWIVTDNVEYYNDTPQVKMIKQIINGSWKYDFFDNGGPKRKMDVSKNITKEFVKSYKELL